LTLLERDDLFVPNGETISEDMQTNKDVNTEYSFLLDVECRPFNICVRFCAWQVSLEKSNSVEIRFLVKLRINCIFRNIVLKYIFIITCLRIFRIHNKLFYNLAIRR
jgi:hypothetical protein